MPPNEAHVTHSQLQTDISCPRTAIGLEKKDVAKWQFLREDKRLPDGRQDLFLRCHQLKEKERQRLRNNSRPGLQEIAFTIHP